MDKIKPNIYTACQTLSKDFFNAMIIYIPDSADKLETTVKPRLLDPNNANATKLFIKLNHFAGSNNAPNEKVLLSKPFIDLLEAHLPKKINFVSIDEGDFDQWLNKKNVGIDDWLDRRPNQKPAFFNEILYFFSRLHHQITALDLSQSTLFTEPLGGRHVLYDIPTRHSNLKVIIKILKSKDKPLTYLALNHSDFNYKGRYLNQWVKAHLPPTLTTIKLDNLKEERRVTEPSLFAETHPLRHEANLLYFPSNVTTLDMSCPYPVNNLFKVNDRSITKENVIYFTNLFSRYLEALPPEKRSDQVKLKSYEPPIYPGAIKTINLSRRNLHKWAIEKNNVPIAKDAHHFITQLWRSIPKSVEKLILKGNKLASLSVENLAKFFEGFPEWVSVELSDNGFNQLPFTELNDKLATLPNTSIEFESEELYLRQDKQVVHIQDKKDEKIGFIPFHKIEYNKNVVNDYVRQLEALCERGICEQDIKKLFTYIPHNSELNSQNNRVQLLKWIAGPLKMNYVVPALQNQILEHAKKRIELFVRNNRHKDELSLNTTLDLSYARLGCLTKEQIQELVLYFPDYVTKLILTNNGFAKTEEALKNLASGVNILKERHDLKIDYMDLSANEFYTKKYTPINDLLKSFLTGNLSNVRLSLSIDTSALAKTHQLRLGWLDSYHEEAKKHHSLLSYAQVLLNSYTMDSNIWLLVLTLQWGRSHFKAICNVSQEITNGSSSNNTLSSSVQLENSNDVLAHLNGYQESNASGDLARRLAALSLFAEKLSCENTARGNEIAPDEADFQMVRFTGNKTS